MFLYKRMLSYLSIALFCFGVIMGTQAATAEENTTQLDLANTVNLDLQGGRVVIQLRPDLAPNHVARIKELVLEGFYGS